MYVGLSILEKIAFEGKECAKEAGHPSRLKSVIKHFQKQEKNMVSISKLNDKISKMIEKTCCNNFNNFLTKCIIDDKFYIIISIKEHSKRKQQFFNKRNFLVKPFFSHNPVNQVFTHRVYVFCSSDIEK